MSRREVVIMLEMIWAWEEEGILVVGGCLDG